MDKGKIEKIRERIISIFDKYLGEDYILFVFGSFVKNNIDRASDIDLAIYSKESLSAFLIAELREELENKVPTLRDIDLVNLTQRQTNKKLLENILTEGWIWKEGRNSCELLKSLKKRLRNLQR